jgi:hypothetical protein
MPAPRLILCEETSRWAVAFRRALGKRSTAIVETRSLAECGRQLMQSPRCVLGIEVTADNFQAVLQSLGDWLPRYSRARALGLVDPALVDAEPILRELGVQAVLYSSREAAPVARLIERHFALAPPDDLPLREAIFARLPWANVARA